MPDDAVDLIVHVSEDEEEGDEEQEGTEWYRKAEWVEKEREQGLVVEEEQGANGNITAK